MLAAILHQKCTQECLGVMLDVLRVLLRSQVELERERAAMIVSFLLLKFQEYCRSKTAGICLHISSASLTVSLAGLHCLAHCPSHYLALSRLLPLMLLGLLPLTLSHYPALLGSHC